MTACRGVWTQEFWRAVLAETLGVAFLLLLGAGSTLTWSAERPPSNVQMSLCFGLAVATMAQCVGPVSGAHLNPAVTAALLVTRRLPLSRGLAFVAAQSLGAVLGAALLLLLTPTRAAGNLGATLLSADVHAAPAVLLELLITLQLVVTVMASSDDRRPRGGSAPLAIGLSVTLGHLFALPYTGSSMNPARSLGSAVVSGLWDNHWVYWLGPLLGGCLGGPLYTFLLCPDKESKQFLRQVLDKASLPVYHPTSSPHNGGESATPGPPPISKHARKHPDCVVLVDGDSDPAYSEPPQHHGAGRRHADQDDGGRKEPVKQQEDLMSSA